MGFRVLGLIGFIGFIIGLIGFIGFRVLRVRVGGFRVLEKGVVVGRRRR